jgi:hypothetical protein
MEPPRQSRGIAATIPPQGSPDCGRRLAALGLAHYRRPMPADTTSKRGPPFDPECLIRQVLDMGAEFRGPAEDILLSWVLSLDRALDPAAAARQVIAAYGFDVPDGQDATLRLRDLLQQAARVPEGAAPDPRRRGRRRAN